MCLMGIVQNLFLAYENTKVMKYIIPENNFDIANIWSLAHGLLQGGLYTKYFKGNKDFNLLLKMLREMFFKIWALENQGGIFKGGVRT